MGDKKKIKIKGMGNCSILVKNEATQAQGVILIE